MSSVASVPSATTAVQPIDPTPPNIPLDGLPVDQRRGEQAMWCVIATELMLFVCMFGSYYYLGTNKDRWAVDMPPSLKYPFFLLAILLASSVVLERGKAMVERGAARLRKGGSVDYRSDWRWLHDSPII